ncbi:agmatine deiminase [Leifsonia sp. 98AMF]|uniref:agmatine deiminase family protein n=1 Tax=unclassified Leifsonia TaxID=2663824 RepID=UPI00087D4728|nr:MULTISPECIES: agmatine deiminase family protein [unclassified Leifsonia]SDH65850.1 agmatine deiminase [Leifsonia sp. 197AMF]SDI73751.1 agmatine deiminase [Leifsonia sp. 466MF]SDK14459.1 agmatine deiminase [Leifsonia sp. 157MF]SDN76753.1 agmatine deiminase [Leifsonia sp. 509MF]SEN31142.1 agmatine deiminase [Leifsonia sp. 467MF]
MTWRMPAETAPHERTWMAFPRAGLTLGDDAASAEEAYASWTAVAHAVAEYEPITMVVDPTERDRARRMLGSHVEQVEAPLDEFWMRDFGPTFVVDDERPGVLGAVDWTFNGWGDPEWAEWHKSAEIARFVAERTGAELISSLLVNEGGGIHVDGEGTVLLTETVQLDPRRNRYADKERVEAELARTIGATHAVWLPRGLTRDYDDFGTNGHVDIVATIPSPGRLLLHAQRDPEHPDHLVSRELRALLSGTTDAAGRSWDIIDLPAPATLRDEEGFVDWSYVNHLVVNDGIVACGFGEERADAEATEILEAAYPGRRVTMVDSRPIFQRGGGIHCITQQQPAVVPAAQDAR